jgi:hypothetical protein
MKSIYFTIHPGKNSLPQNGGRLKSIFIYNKCTSFTPSTFPIQPDFSQNQRAAITPNAGSSRTLHKYVLSPVGHCPEEGSSAGEVSLWA